MNLRSFPEFSLGEFATTEFSRGSSAIIRYTSFGATASSEALFASNRYLLASLAVVGESTIDLDAGSFVYTRLDGFRGLSDFEGIAQSVKTAVTRVRNTSTAQIAGGLTKLTVFDIDSDTLTEFISHSDPIFAIKGSSSALSYSGATKNIDVVIESPGSLHAFGQKVLDTRYATKGFAKEEFYGNTVKNGRLVIRHRSASRFTGQYYSLSSYDAQVQSESHWEIAKIAQRGFDVIGDADADFLSQYLRYIQGDFSAEGIGEFLTVADFQHFIATEFKSHGESKLLLPANKLRPTSYVMQGDANAEFVRGSRVFLSLPRAFYVVERPYENRTVLRYTDLTGRSR